MGSKSVSATILPTEELNPLSWIYSPQILLLEEGRGQRMGQNWSRGQLLIPCLFLFVAHLKVETFKQFKYGGMLLPVTSKYAVIGSKVFSINKT